MNFRRLGYIDCSNKVLELLLHNTTDAEIPKQIDLLVELAYNQIYSFHYHVADSIASQALKLAERLPAKHAGGYYIAANANHRNHRTELAREQVGEALELAKKAGNEYLQIRILSLMGVINRDVFFGASLKAIPDHVKALELAQAVKDTSFIINELLVLGLNYGDAGQLNQHFDYLRQALDYLQRFEDIGLRMRIQNVLCDDLLREKKFEDAERLRLLTLHFAEASHSLYTGDINFRLYEQYFETKQYGKAKAALDRAHDILKNAGVTGPNLLGIHEGYYALAKATNQHELALQSLEKAYSSVSLNYTQRNAELLSRLETQYRTGEKERLLQEKESLLKTTQHQRTIVVIFAALVTMLGAAVFIFFIRQRNTSRLLAQQNETINQQSKELQSLEKLKSRFFANVSHELRTPLMLILGPVNSLLKRHQEEGDEKKLLHFVQRNAQQLQRLINEILDLSKLEDNKMIVVEEPVLFFSYLNEQLAQFHYFASSVKLNFELKCQADMLLKIMLDKSKFEKIIHNYLSNAMKFTPPGGKVTLVVEDMGAQLQLIVTDTGQGIHPDDLPHVFDRFYQANQPDFRAEGGTGIGLSLVKELAELLGGMVWVESELKKGSVFYFRFPKKLAMQMENGEWRMENGHHVGTQPSIENGVLNYVRESSISQFSILNSPSILVVEDNPDLREYLRLLLSDYQVFTAENGQAALDLLIDAGGRQPTAVNRQPDLIISDLMMPVMDGFQFLEKLKSDDRFRHLPVIILTAKVNIHSKLQALRIGVDDYLIKPFQEEELKARIENLLHNYRERMAFRSKNRMETGEATAPEESIITSVDSLWLQEVESIYTKHLNDDRLSVDFAAGKLSLSERQFNRRLKQLTGLSPNHYLQEMRLQRARDLLLDGNITAVKEAAFTVGFHDVRYFSSLFKQRFGSNPSDLRK
ncbi:MAG: response regulator [Saprospiraceae bacterium]|nr:response regulator [Saprospiraceae bacterium]